MHLFISKTILAIAAVGMIGSSANRLVQQDFLPVELPNSLKTVTDTSIDILEANQIEIPETPKPQLISMGTYKISAYCPCVKCCGKTDGITASGEKATANHTVAMNGVPFGTHIMIDGKEYVVEDRGGGLGRKIIDVFFNTHEEALNSGLWYDTEVFMIAE